MNYSPSHPCSLCAGSCFCFFPCYCGIRFFFFPPFSPLSFSSLTFCSLFSCLSFSSLLFSSSSQLLFYFILFYSSLLYYPLFPFFPLFRCFILFYLILFCSSLLSSFLSSLLPLPSSLFPLSSFSPLPLPIFPHNYNPSPIIYSILNVTVDGVFKEILFFFPQPMRITFQNLEKTQ